MAGSVRDNRGEREGESDEGIKKKNVDARKMENKDSEMRCEKGRRERRGRIEGKSGGGSHRGKRERQKGEKVCGKGVGRRGGLHAISLEVPAQGKTGG